MESAYSCFESADGMLLLAVSQPADLARGHMSDYVPEQVMDAIDAAGVQVYPLVESIFELDAATVDEVKVALEASPTLRFTESDQLRKLADG